MKSIAREMWDDLWWLIVPVALLFALMIYVGVRSAQVGGRCIELGYTGARTTVDWDGFHGFCTKRTDASDVVVPLADGDW